MQRKGTDEKRSSLGLYYAIVAVCILLMFAGKYIPPFAPEITPVGMGVLGVFVGVVLLWSTVGHSIWPSILAVVALGCSGYTSVNAAISASLGSFMVFSIICGSAITASLTTTGADQKIAHWLISRKTWEGRPRLFSFAFLFTFFLVSSLTFAFAMIFVCWTVLRKIAQEMGVTMRHPYFVVMSIYSVVATSLGEFVIPLKGWQLALCTLFMDISGITLNYTLYIITTFLIGVLLLVILTLLMRPLFHIDMMIIRDFHPEELEGKETRLTGNQIITVVVLVASIVLSIAANYLHGSDPISVVFSTLSMPGIFGLAVVILCIIKGRAGKPLLDFPRVMNGMIWGPLLLVGIAICLSSALTAEECGFMAFFSRVLLPFMDGKPVAFIYAFIILTAVVLTNVASNTGIGMMMVPISVPICMATGCNMNVAAIVCIYSACYGFIFPSSAAVSPLMYSNPDLTKKEILVHTSLPVFLYIVIGCIVFPVLDVVLP